ncbi:protein of unknown function DUF641, plant [Dillenia turbinata]|uniref:DUF641 domain-containing protein n=1 Tax=Dillenia turbinata TaxID=194707 RepID=A0AAN8VBI9_9MAGN
MANKVSNFSDLIQRVTASCFLHPLAAERQEISKTRHKDEDDDDDNESETTKDQDDDHGDKLVELTDEEDKEEEKTRVWKREKKKSSERERDMEELMVEVFDAVSVMKRAYVSLQDAHCPWDAQKMREADVAVVAELRRLGVLRERFRRNFSEGKGGVMRAAVSLKEVVAPYEAAVEELKREVKTKGAEIENLKEKLKSMNGGGGKKGRSHSHRSKSKVSFINQVAAPPGNEMFEATMSQVRETAKSFTTLLLSLMRSARWDITAAVRSIEAATTTTTTTITTAAFSVVGAQHAKYALQSYVCRKIFEGFDHETFYMDGSLSSLLNPDRYRRDCFTQYNNMKAMDPIELLGILPTSHFGKFCFKKYLSIVHQKMEESLFGDLEQRRQVLAGNHPRSEFYGEFLGLAKAVWLLHLLAFSMEPSPSQFEASRGAEFNPDYMESVVRFSSRVPVDMVVGFPVCPGFKLRNGSVVKAWVYLVSKS